MERSISTIETTSPGSIVSNDSTLSSPSDRLSDTTASNHGIISNTDTQPDHKIISNASDVFRVALFSERETILSNNTTPSNESRSSDENSSIDMTTSSVNTSINLETKSEASVQGVNGPEKNNNEERLKSMSPLKMNISREGMIKLEGCGGLPNVSFSRILEGLLLLNVIESDNITFVSMLKIAGKLNKKTRSALKYMHVDTVQKVATMMDALIRYLTPALLTTFINLEGTNLGEWTGETSIVAIYHRLTCHAFLMHVSVIGKAAFDTSSISGMSLRQMLESPRILKAFRDIRNDSAGLYRGFDIKLAGIRDIQLLACKKRFASEPNRPRLEVAIGACCAMTRTDQIAFNNTKTAGKRLWSTKEGGSFEVFKEVPLKPLTKAYSLGETVFLPEAYEVLMGGLNKEELYEVDAETKKAVGQSEGQNYQAGGHFKAKNPFFVPRATCI